MTRRAGHRRITDRHRRGRRACRWQSTQRCCRTGPAGSRRRFPDLHRRRPLWPAHRRIRQCRRRATSFRKVGPPSAPRLRGRPSPKTGRLTMCSIWTGGFPERRRSRLRFSSIPDRLPPCRIQAGLAVAALIDTYRVSATVTFDPNVRPSLIADREQAVARIRASDRTQRHREVSEEDLRWIDPDRSTRADRAHLAGAGPALVVVTMADQGAMAVCAAGEARVPTRAVQVVDTVGAGDSFMAGLLDALWGSGLLGGDRRTACVDRGGRADRSARSGEPVVGADRRPRGSRSAGSGCTGGRFAPTPKPATMAERLCDAIAAIPFEITASVGTSSAPLTASPVYPGHASHSTI